MTIYHGRVTSQGANVNVVEGVAVLNLGGTAMISNFFDCHTTQGSPEDLRWTKEEGTQRFPTDSADLLIDDVTRRVLRMDLAPTTGGGMAAGNADTGVYICTNTAAAPPQSVSVNITGGKPH